MVVPVVGVAKFNTPSSAWRRLGRPTKRRTSVHDHDAGVADSATAATLRGSGPRAGRMMGAGPVDLSRFTGKLPGSSRGLSHCHGHHLTLTISTFPRPPGRRRLGRSDGFC